jgi:hypothetical protein
MSDRIDKFIKQHKEYFKRNASVIESNLWDKEEDLSRKAKLFKQENDLTNSIVSRLAAFIKIAEADRNLAKTKKFIEDTLDIINIHIIKCDTYLDYKLDELIESTDDTDEQIDLKTQEISFQDNVFNEKISIQDKLDSLNLKNEADDLKFRFYSDQIASLPMASVLTIVNNDIKVATESLNLATEIKDKSFYKDLLEKGKALQWNEKKHYWEQSKDVLLFWQNEWLKITKGFDVDGYYIHPWLYFHINFYKTPIPQEDGSEPIVNPDFRDNEWLFVEEIKRAEEAGNQGVMLYGSRRLGKSTLMSSYCYWKALTKPNSSATITSGSEGDLIDLTHKIKTAMKYIPKAFYLYVQSQEWLGGSVELGLKTTASNLVEYSRFSIKNLAGGTTKSTQKTAGGAPSVYLIEEIGKFDWKKSYLAGKPSFETKHKWKCIPIAVGTGGEASLSGDAMSALSNPSSLNFLEMDWDNFESKIPIEAISWKRRTFATFVPAQMSYKVGLRNIKRPFGEFLGINSEELDKITIFQSDWKHNLEVLLKDRNNVKNDNLLLQQETVQYPIDPEEVFLSSDISPFSNIYEEARQHKEYLLETGLWDRRFDLIKDINGNIEAIPSQKPLVEFPFKGDNQDAPYLIIQHPPKKPPKYMYVASGDFYKQEKATSTDSVATVSVYKFDIYGDDYAKTLVATYAGRPKTFRELNQKIHILLEYYNAKFLPENEDMGQFQTYMESLRLEDEYLEKHIDFKGALNLTEGGARKYGWTPSQSKTRLISMYATYLDMPVKRQNDIGEEVVLKRIQTIDDIWLLSEIMAYSENGNYDRVSGHIGSIGYLHYLEKNYIYPKINFRDMRDQEDNKQPKPQRTVAHFRQNTHRRPFISRRGR